MLLSLARFVVLLSLLVSASSALAQEALPAPWATPAPGETRLTPPPIVEPPPELEPGAGAVRGSRVPNRVSVAGDSRRKDLTLYVDRGLNPVLGPGESKGKFQPLCLAPCEFQLPNGRYRFAVTYGDASLGEQSRMLKVRPALQIKHGDQLVLRHRSLRWLRIAGGIVIATCTLAGAYLAGTSQQGDDGPVNQKRLAWGIALPAVAVVGGITMVAWPDPVDGRVEPGR